MKLAGEVAVVTGAGRGIGAGSALALAECGADIVLAARTQTQLDEVAAQIEALGRKAVTVACDLSDLDAVGRLAEVATAGCQRSWPLKSRSTSQTAPVGASRIVLLTMRGTFSLRTRA